MSSAGLQDLMSQASWALIPTGGSSLVRTLL